MYLCFYLQTLIFDAACVIKLSMTAFVSFTVNIHGTAIVKEGAGQIIISRSDSFRCCCNDSFFSVAKITRHHTWASRNQT